MILICNIPPINGTKTWCLVQSFLFIYALSLIHFQKHKTISVSSVNFQVYLDIGVLSYNLQQNFRFINLNDKN